MTRSQTHGRALATALMCALTCGCAPPTAEQQCFVDEQCPDAMACVEGFCGEPGGSSGSDGSEPVEKLDVGGGIGNATTCEAASFVATNAGCEFWAVDLPNAWHASSAYSLDIAANQTFAVVVANVSEEEFAHVSVFAGDESSAIEDATVGPLGTYAFLLPNSLQISAERNDGGRAFRVESDVPITAYQFQPLDNLRPVYSNDATSLLPAHVLQDDYIAITEIGTETTMYPAGWEAVSLPTGAFVTVVATENDTDVEFFPTTQLLDGGISGVRLDRGETFTILSDPPNAADDASLAGTRVLSSKPVAAFAGNVAASVPRTATECCRDHVEHQLLPTVAWGVRYIVAPPPDTTTSQNNDPAVVRLVGAYDGTALAYPAGKPANAPDVIDAHQSIEFSTGDPVIIESTDPTKPFAVAQFLYNSGEANAGGLRGDPSMIVVPAVEQQMDRYVFLVPVGYATSSVTVVAPSGADVELDGKGLSAASTIGSTGGVEWGYRRAEIGPGAHVLSASTSIGITVVGYDRQVSYAYAGGSAVNIISEAPPTP